MHHLAKLIEARSGAAWLAVFSLLTQLISLTGCGPQLHIYQTDVGVPSRLSSNSWREKQMPQFSNKRSDDLTFPFSRDCDWPVGLRRELWPQLWGESRRFVLRPFAFVKTSKYRHGGRRKRGWSLAPPLWFLWERFEFHATNSPEWWFPNVVQTPRRKHTSLSLILECEDVQRAEHWRGFFLSCRRWGIFYFLKADCRRCHVS